MNKDCSASSSGRLWCFTGQHFRSEAVPMLRGARSGCAVAPVSYIFSRNSLPGLLIGWPVGWPSASLTGWLAGCFAGWLAGWLAGWPAGRPAGRLVGWLVGWLAGELACRLVSWLAACWAGRQTTPSLTKTLAPILIPTPHSPPTHSYPLLRGLYMKTLYFPPFS